MSSQSPRMYLSPPFMAGEELNEVLQAFSDNWIAPVGPHLTEFENQITSYIGMDHAVALSSGTAAIHLALIMMGVERGDEVLCSSFTFCGSCNPIVYQGATPVFIDSESDTWNMCPETLEKAIEDRIKQTNKKPKAMIVVHLYGMPAKMDQILEISQKYDIPIIEDAAEALGSVYNGQMLGSFGDIGILSFNGNKIITTSGGGMLVTNTKKYVEKARFLATQARDDAAYYQHTELGYNYRMSNICAAIGVGQMKTFEQIVDKTRVIHSWYKEQLQNGILLDEQSDVFQSNHWLNCILLPEGKSEQIRLALEEENIESRPLWKPMHLQPLFKDAPFYGTGVAEKLFDTGLCLPSGVGMSESDVKRVTDVINKLLM